MGSITQEYKLYFKTITSNVRLYYWILLVSAISASAFNILFGIYLKNIGYSEHIVGSILSLMTLGTALGAFPVSIYAAQFSKRNTIIGGLMVMLSMGLVMINFKATLIIQVASLIYGMGQASVMILQGPILFENTDEEHRITAFSMAFVLQNLAFVISSFILGHLSASLADIWSPQAANAFVLNGATILISLSIALSLRFNGEGMLKRQKHSSRTAAVMQTFVDFKNVLQGGALLYVLQVAFIGFGAGLVVPFFSVYLKFMLNITDGAVGTIMAISQIGTIIGGLSVSPLAKRFGRVKTVIFCQLLSIPFLIFISFPQGLIIIAISFFFRSSLMNMAHPIISSLAMEIVDDDVRTHMSSVVSMTSHLFRALGIYIGGYLMYTVSYNFPYYITILCYLIGTYIFRITFRNIDKKQEISHKL
jgi:MFS family permease